MTTPSSATAAVSSTSSSIVTAAAAPGGTRPQSAEPSPALLPAAAALCAAPAPRGSSSRRGFPEGYSLRTHSSPRLPIPCGLGGGRRKPILALPGPGCTAPSLRPEHRRARALAALTRFPTGAEPLPGAPPRRAADPGRRGAGWPAVPGDLHPQSSPWQHPRSRSPARRLSRGGALPADPSALGRD